MTIHQSKLTLTTIIIKTMEVSFLFYFYLHSISFYMLIMLKFASTFINTSFINCGTRNSLSYFVGQSFKLLFFFPGMLCIIVLLKI